MLAGSSVSYENVAVPAGTAATIKIGETVIASYAAKGLAAGRRQEARTASSRRRVADALKAAGYPAKADPAKMNKPLIVAHPGHPGDPT